MDPRRNMSVTERLYTPASQGDKFLKQTPLHAPNPLVIRQKLRNMSSLQLQMDNVQTQYRDKLKSLGVSTPTSAGRPRSGTMITFSGKGKVKTVRSKRVNSVSDVAPIADLLWSSK